MRRQAVLAEGWFVRLLETDRPDAGELARQAAAPDDSWLAATMPAQVHDVLLAHGRIADPHVGRSAAESAWVGERDWAYACRFATPKPGRGPALLRLDGLDTLAEAWLNGEKIGRFRNMYRRYAVDVSGRLAPAGEDSVLLIVFSSPLRFVQQAAERAKADGLPAHKRLRKCHSDFGSYLGARPHSVKVGVCGDVTLDMLDEAWIEDVRLRTDLADDHSRATLRAEVATAGEAAALGWVLLDPDGQEVARGECPPGAGQGAHLVEIELDGPRLWWPWTHGRPYLYRLHVGLRAGGRDVDWRDLAIGIRRIRPLTEDPTTGEKRFCFEVNGRAIFLRGANWAPAEGMTHCWRPERARRLLDLHRRGRMNVLRVWGEGYEPPEAFYDECDRRGVLVWQDFMFGYGMHPEDADFLAECRAEIEGMVRRLRNHPCLLLWCGGNENHMGWDFQHGGQPAAGRRLFDEVMPEACARLDPDRLFHPSSPFGGRRPNWPLEGDWHDYSTLTFSPEASVPLFASEIGRVSAPSLASMRRFLSEQELWPAGHDAAVRAPGKAAWPEMWQYRSVGGSWDKIGPIEGCCDAASAEDLVRVLGTAHGEYLFERVARQRRGVPDGAPDGPRRCWGNIVWRLNDPWPILYWSVIDYYLEPKMAWYYLRRAYEAVLVCFERTPDRICAWVVNDSPEAAAGTLVVRRRRFDGTCKGTLQADVEVAPGQARRVLDLTGLGPVPLREEFLQADFAGRQTTMLLAAERYLHLPRATLNARIVDDAVKVSGDLFARQVSLEIQGVTGAVFEDNFFDLPPGQPRTVQVVDAAGGKEVVVRALNAPAARLRL